LFVVVLVVGCFVATSTGVDATAAEVEDGDDGNNKVAWKKHQQLGNSSRSRRRELLAQAVDISNKFHAHSYSALQVLKQQQRDNDRVKENGEVIQGRTGHNGFRGRTLKTGGEPSGGGVKGVSSFSTSSLSSSSKGYYPPKKKSKGGGTPTTVDEGGIATPTRPPQFDIDGCVDQCLTNLRAPPTPSNLFVQMASQCVLTYDPDRDGYELTSTQFDDETYVFSDRPFRYESVVPTIEFFNQFEEVFTNSEFGNPNAAITLVHEDTNQFEGPVVAVFVEAVYREDDGSFTYMLAQSPEQASVLPLSDFISTSAGNYDSELAYVL